MNLGWLALVVEAVGILCAIRALYQVRTPQGTIAWVVILVAFAPFGIPAYLLFGRRRFHGYVLRRRKHLREMAGSALAVAKRYRALGIVEDPRPEERGFVALARLPFTVGNDAELLIDGTAMFRSLLAGIESATKYVLVQFYILMDDHVGRLVRDALVAKARAGVRVRVLYDEIGSQGLPDAYVASLADAGVEIHPFHTRRGPANRFQLNFRNHRKLVVVDGAQAWVGGFNVGDEYLGRDRAIGPWRDTHVRVAGPVVTTLQVSFVEDWDWASGAALDLTWETPVVARPGVRALALPSGPADEMETGSLLVTGLAHAAKSRLWLATPYFVPDLAVLSALIFAAMRGVDVRVLVPTGSDHRLVWLARFAFVEACEQAGITILEYSKAFLHEKVIVVDDRFAAIGTMNVDNRSLRLNFELTVLFHDARFTAETAAMLEADMEGATPLTVAAVKARGFLFGLGVRVANLFAPIL